MALRGLKGGGYTTYKALEQAGLSDADVAGKTKDEVEAMLTKSKTPEGSLTPEQQQNLKNYVLNFAKKQYPGGGVGKDGGYGVNEKELDRIVKGGWENIPNGELVYVSTFHKGEPYGKKAANPDKTYHKVDENSVKDQDGKVMPINTKQKNNMVASYALQKAVVKPALL